MHVAWEPLAMALFCVVMGLWTLGMGLLGRSGDLAPGYRDDNDRRRSFERMIYALSPAVHTAGTRFLLVVCGIGILAAAVWCVKLAFTA